MAAIHRCLWMLLAMTVWACGSVSGSGVFELRIKAFANPAGRDSELRCCGKCSQPCETKFRVCLMNYQLNINLGGECIYGDFTTPVIGENSFGFAANDSNYPGGYSVKFPFDFSWPGTFSLVLEAWHDPSDNSSLTGGKSLLLRLATQRWLEASDQWRNDSYVSPTTSHAVEFDFRVRCDAHYYGDGCANLCRPRDDKFGHYECSNTGHKKCLPGWTGEYCTKAICLAGCHDEHGYCNEPNECLCKLGWQGRLCNQCIRYPGCLHGTCQQPWQCYCDEGWGGLFCNQDLNYCTNHKPCQNGGTCFNTGQGSYTCSCPAGYTGTDCELLKDDCTVLPCLNGGTCSGSSASAADKAAATCHCPPGYEGVRCETRSGQRCADKPCLHSATCIDTPDNGYLCLCPPGFEGTNCGQQVDNCATNPCLNGGTCLDRVNSFSCLCAPGFAGDKCQTKVNDCAASNPCLNGGTCLNQGGPGKFVCLCPAGFTGVRCQTADKIGSFSQLEASDKTEASDDLTVGQIVLIATLSAAVPLLAAASCVAIVCLKKRRRKERQRADEEARRQNEQNVVASISKKLDEHRIVNSLDFPKASSAKCVNDVGKPLNTDARGKFATRAASPTPLRDKDVAALDRRLDVHPNFKDSCPSSTKNSNETKRPFASPGSSKVHKEDVEVDVEDVLATAV